MANFPPRSDSMHYSEVIEFTQLINSDTSDSLSFSGPCGPIVIGAQYSATPDAGSQPLLNPVSGYIVSYQQTRAVGAADGLTNIAPYVMVIQHTVTVSATPPGA
jgi:hypothetical protein